MFHATALRCPMALITPVKPDPDLVTVPLLLSSAGIDRPRTFLPLFAQTLRALVQGTVSESFRKMHHHAYSPQAYYPRASPFPFPPRLLTFPALVTPGGVQKQPPDSGSLPWSGVCFLCLLVPLVPRKRAGIVFHRLYLLVFWPCRPEFRHPQRPAPDRMYPGRRGWHDRTAFSPRGCLG